MVFFFSNGIPHTILSAKMAIKEFKQAATSNLRTFVVRSYIKMIECFSFCVSDVLYTQKYTIMLILCNFLGAHIYHISPTHLHLQFCFYWNLDGFFSSVFLMNINNLLVDYRLKKILTVTKRPIILTLAFIFITFLLHCKRHLFLNDSNLNAHISLTFHREVKITFY